MKKPTLLYIPLVLLLAVAAAAFVLNVVRVTPLLQRFVNPPAVRSPVKSANGITKLQPEAQAAGLQVGDRLVSINGRVISSEMVILDELSKISPGETITYNFERENAAGEIERRETKVIAASGGDENSLSQRTLSFLVMCSFWILLPGISFLLGFYVAFVRPRDSMAWLVLLMMLSIGSIGFDGSSGFVSFTAAVFIQFWGVWMLLFGIYFPERLELDRRFPFVKWVIIVPLSFISVLNITRFAVGILGFEAISRWLNTIFAPLGAVQMILMMVCIGLFFMSLGIKSGTLKNPDSRRRLRLLMYGTSLALTPTFLIIIFAIASGARGAVFEIVPAWAAITAILAIPIFPLTMAYVIVVQRAMDVSVVVRQGLQYALAQNGVRVLQIFLSVLIIFLAVLLVSNPETGVWQKMIFISLGIATNILIGKLANRIKLWMDRRFFREAYNAEQILSDLSEEVRTMVETKPLLEIVSNKISESLHVPQVALFLKNGDYFQPAYALGFGDAPPLAMNEKAVTIAKLRRNEAVTIYADDAENWVNNTPNFEDEREVLAKLNSQLLLPVGVKEKLSGFLSLSPKKSEAPYTPSDLRLLKSVAAQTGLALENSRLTEAIVSETALRERLNREVEIAREVQERLFPQDLPKIEGLDYFGGCRPALGVGGDYYDFFELENDKFGIAIGDVSGKGIGASLMMASLQASLRGQAIHFDEDLAALMCNVNRLVYETSTSNRYATFFYSQYNRKNRKLTYVNAGHNPPFLFRKTGGDYELLRLEEGGAVVGMLPPMLISYTQGEIQMQSGDLLIGFTDGISEAMNPQDEEWEEPQMIEVIRAKIDLPAAEMFKYLVECADNFADGAKQHDDMTAIIVRLI